MKGLSIRLKITLWFSAVLLIVVTLTYYAILSVSDQVIQKTVRDSLIETVENNVDEIEYFASIEDVDFESDVDHFVEYESGYLEIDDDFLDAVNGVYTTLYHADGAMLYGENPVAVETAALAFANTQVQTVTAEGTVYYVFDRKLDGEGLDGLWLRGVVSERQGETQLADISRVSLFILPSLVLLAIIGGYLIARRTLRPIHKISVTAAQISRGGDLKKRIEIGNGKDELHQLAESFNGMFERLDSAFEAERQFTSDASHELRTPMSVIMTQCEFALSNAKSEEEYREALQVVERQGKKMSKLIEDMLTFMRMENRTYSCEKKELDFSELVRSVCHDMAMIQEKGITLTSDAEEGVTVLGNEELLNRLLMNLISNAYRYGRENGHIHVTLKKETGGVQLAVADDGIGISEEDQGKIFRRFYQADSSRSCTGTGLGLAIAEEISRLHGGRLTVESKVGKGSTFRFFLPE